MTTFLIAAAAFVVGVALLPTIIFVAADSERDEVEARRRERRAG